MAAKAVNGSGRVKLLDRDAVEIHFTESEEVQ
jgi:hypothetical protein